MGTTLTTWQAGSFELKYVVAIEGYKYLLTDATPAQATNAWTGTDWTSALGGLVVDMQNQCSINPWAPLGGGGGTCRLWVQPDMVTDQFGIDTHRKSAGAENLLAATIDHDDTTASLADTTSFAVGPGEAFIGTECIGYASKTGGNPGSLNTLTRGKYAPFKSGGASPVGFAAYHRQGLDTNLVQLDPVVSQQPRMWIGKWVGVWVHRVVRDVLDTKANAQLVFAGRIIGVAQDPNTGWTVVEIKHVLDVVKDSTLGRSLFQASLADGMYIETGNKFTWQDDNGGGVVRTANDLTVVASGASGANQMNAGFYAHADICTILNNWLAAEVIAARLFGKYVFTSPVLMSDGTFRTTIDYRMASGGTSTMSFNPIFPTPVLELFGFTTRAPVSSGRAVIGALGGVVLDGSGNAGVYVDSSSPRRTVLYRHNSGLQPHRVKIDTFTGTFVDQYATMPQAVKPTSSGGLTWGLFLIDNSLLVRAAYDTSTQYLSQIVPANPYFHGAPATQGSAADAFGKGFDDPSEIPVRQVLMFETSFLGLIARIFYGTGTANYNSATYDDQVYGFGLGIPGELLGANFETSITNLPGSDKSLVLVLDKPTKIADLIASDLILRRACLIWKNGGLRFATIVVPTTAAAVATLGESSKALAASSADMARLRSATTLTTEWQCPLVKIEYNRSITDLQGTGYQSNISIEDATSVDDQGGAGDPRTISARNTYGQFLQTGAGIEQIAPFFLATMPLFSRPVRRMMRTIDQRYFEMLAPGDVVTINDNFARDPATGARGVSTRPGVITRITYTLGAMKPGGDPDKPSPQAGTVDIFFLDVNRTAAYCPTAQVDDTAVAGGFDHGYDSVNHKLRCYAHQHSEVSEAADAANFNNLDVVEICEIDPANPAAPTSWVRTISAVSGNDITFSAALSSPAWDNTKRYRISADHYGDATASQQANTFMAANTTKTVEGTRSPYAYGYGTTPGSYTPWATGELGELLADFATTAGNARDTGNERGFIRLVNALHDYRTARCSPMLSTREATSAPAGGKTYQVLFFAPIFLTKEISSPFAARRSLRVAPLFKSASGSSVTIRVTLLRDRLIDGSWDDVNRGTSYAEATWTTTSTAYQTGAEAALTIIPKDPSGIAFILVEGTQSTMSRGLSMCLESYRQSSF